MKKITIPALTVLAISLLAGCSPPNGDSAKIEALTEKVNLLVQNQGVIYTNLVNLHDMLMVLNGQMSAVPSVHDLSGLSQADDTNSLAKLDKIDSELDMLGQLTDLRGSANGAALTNLLNDTSDIKSSLLNIQRDLTRIQARMGM